MKNNTSQTNDLPKQNIQWWEMKIDDFPILERRNIDTGEKLQVALYDFEKLMNWHDAVIKCKSIGDDWRLPTLNELEILYKELHLKNIGNFYGSWDNRPTYWSITELSRPDEKLQLNFIDENGELKSKLIERKEAWVFNFSRGDKTYNSKKLINRIRVVRNL
jgi:hypothetical protein